MAQTQNAQHQSEIAGTILRQMGGSGKLEAMLGANNFYAMPESETAYGGVQFRFKGCTKANYLEVHLALDDTYTMKFYKIKGFDIQPVQEFSTIYCDQLVSEFEEFTGLRCSL